MSDTSSVPLPETAFQSPNPRLDAFKRAIMTVMREAGHGKALSTADLLDAVRPMTPELFDDNEACYPKCKHKAKWQHHFERAIYDLRQTRPPKLLSAPNRRGWYVLG